MLCARRSFALAKRAGIAGRVHPGSVTFVQRFGSSLNLHAHLHTCALDGVFVEREGGVEFVAAAPPSRAELYALVGRVFVRATKWLQRHGHLRDEADVSNEPHSPSFEEALVLAATGRGTMDVLRDDGESSEPEGETHDAPGGGSTDAVTHHGFNLHAGVTVAADDDVGRERLCRYGLRPPFSLSRFRWLRDGRIAYRTKKSKRGAAKHRVMTPVECLTRLSALIPPPKYPLTRFHGVLAPRAKLRRLVVPKPPENALPACAKASGPPIAEPALFEPRAAEPVVSTRPVRSAAALALVVPGAEASAPNVLSAKHLERIAGGLLYAATPNVPWATLLRRTFEVDTTACARCGGRVRVRAIITDPKTAERILDALAKPNARAPPSPFAA